MRFSKVAKTVVMTVCVSIVLLAFGTVHAQANAASSTYSFVYLGDLHFDQRSHHDLDWVKATMPGDLRQIEEYDRNTAQYTPGLLKRVQAAVESSHGDIKMVIQGGDLTEGLCGTRERQEIQFQDARQFVRRFLPEVAFIAVKGNHDITGPGAKEAYENVMLPWLSQECGKKVDSASFSFLRGPDLFIFFDAYQNNSLDWLEKTLKENAHRYAFVVMHPPAVPYGARSTWHLFSRAKEQATRERFLNILGAERAILLTAHLHKYHLLARKTATGTFVQFSVSSVISSSNASVKDLREGVKDYDERLLDLEPEFQPATKEERRQSLAREKPYITRFEYADCAGYAILHVSETNVTADIYVGDSDKPWKTVPLAPALDN